MSAITYRPPIWSQNGSYSAADDRRLIQCAFSPGVIEEDGLQVVRRGAGANMSVDVLPGHVVVRGTTQADQGSYLCALAQRVNIPIAAGPAAGQHRRTNLFARVFEPGGSQEAYWQIVTVNGAAGPTSADPPSVSRPQSSTPLASVYPIRSGTTQITAGMIDDRRFRARNPLSQLKFVEKNTDGRFDLGDNEHLLVRGGASVTVWLPEPAKDAICGIFVQRGEASVRTPSGDMVGPGMTSAQRFQLGARGSQLLFQSNGGNWYMIAGHPDTGWSQLNRPSWITFNPNNPPSARKQGDIVYLRGRYHRDGQRILAGSRVVLLPENFTPQRGWWVPSLQMNAPRSLLISPEGYIQAGDDVAAGRWCYLDGISYMMD